MKYSFLEVACGRRLETNSSSENSTSTEATTDVVTGMCVSDVSSPNKEKQKTKKKKTPVRTVPCTPKPSKKKLQEIKRNRRLDEKYSAKFQMISVAFYEMVIRRTNCLFKVMMMTLIRSKLQTLCDTTATDIHPLISDKEGINYKISVKDTSIPHIEVEKEAIFEDFVSLYVLDYVPCGAFTIDRFSCTVILKISHCLPEQEFGEELQDKIRMLKKKLYLSSEHIQLLSAEKETVAKNMSFAGVLIDDVCRQQKGIPDVLNILTEKECSGVDQDFGKFDFLNKHNTFIKTFVCYSHAKIHLSSWSISVLPNSIEFPIGYSEDRRKIMLGEFPDFAGSSEAEKLLQFVDDVVVPTAFIDMFTFAYHMSKDCAANIHFFKWLNDKCNSLCEKMVLLVMINYLGKVGQKEIGIIKGYQLKEILYKYDWVEAIRFVDAKPPLKTKHMARLEAYSKNMFHVCGEAIKAMLNITTM